MNSSKPFSFGCGSLTLSLTIETLRWKIIHTHTHNSQIKVKATVKERRASMLSAAYDCDVHMDRQRSIPTS